MTELDKRRHAYRHGLAAESLRGRVDAQHFVRGEPRQVVAPVAPLRRRPCFDAPLDTEALFGEEVTVFDEQEGWAWAQLACDGYVGYVPTEALGPAGDPPTHRVTALRTYVYPAADIKAPPLDSLSLGSLLRVAGMDGRFLRLAGEGFVYSAHADPIGETAADFVGVAERFVHTPYLWGGRSGHGLDCSGLVQLSLQAAGAACPRDSDMQEQELGSVLGNAPSLEGLRRGDLLFWDGHVAIMTDARQLIHANGHHMAVVIESAWDAVERIAASGVPLRTVRRPSAARA